MLGWLTAQTLPVFPPQINGFAKGVLATGFRQTLVEAFIRSNPCGICVCRVSVNVNGLLMIALPHRSIFRCLTNMQHLQLQSHLLHPVQLPPNNVLFSLTLALHDQRPPQFSSAGSSTTSPARKKTRLSGPPRPYSATPAASVNDFAEPAAGPALVSITVGILPKVLSNSDYVDSLDHSPAYFWKSGDELEIAQRRLAAANLVFHVQVNESGPIFEVINTGFLAHCLKHKIVFVTPTPVFADGIVVITPSTMPWVLTGPKGRPGNRSWVEDPKCLTAFTFTVSALRASPFNNTPNHLSAGILIFIVPKLRNLIAPIDCLFETATRLPMHVLHHQCFARRMLHPILASLSDDPSPTCSAACTRTAPYTVELTHTATSSTPIGEYLDLTRPLRSLSSDDSDSDSGVCLPGSLTDPY
ncbi:hypothetical protein B0H19DRAFT_1261069 [Mycena capillaripes]|nr:hypothetical protein B0H19DRAFT_1261069 [Mycena capillaripes]